MLRAIVHLASVATMLFGIEVPVGQIELDGLNGPTLEPFPQGTA